MKLLGGLFSPRLVAYTSSGPKTTSHWEYGLVSGELIGIFVCELFKTFGGQTKKTIMESTLTVSCILDRDVNEYSKVYRCMLTDFTLRETSAISPVMETSVVLIPF
jgi:hypothetical protein